MNHDNDISNKTKNTPFPEVLNKYAKRRDVLRGGLAFAAGTFFAGASSVASAGERGAKKHFFGHAKKHGLIDFTPVTIEQGTGPWPSIAPEYQFDVLIPWGTPIQPNGPAYNWPPTAKDQAQQVGIGHDGMHFFPIKNCRSRRFGQENKANKRCGNKHGMLALNNEFGINSHVLGKSMPDSLEDVRVSQHAHGVTIVEIKKVKKQWRTVKSKRARRIHVNTPVAFSGPVAGHHLLQTPNGNVALGTVNNCASGYTPWGTYLTCEENFNGYFGATNRENSWHATDAQLRYGFSETGFNYGWEEFDRRFDLSDIDYKNEENRFGWVVEIDPMNATQKPVKRTALGRFKHEGVAITVGRGGRVVAYMGDDQRFDYIYKFVSEDNWRAMRARGVSPLDHGKLYVARFDEDGTGRWLELTIDNPELAANFEDQAEILVHSRLAADILGATPMDRPEWTSVAPNGDVYCTLTNNTKRTQADAANPQAPNADGHIIRWHDTNKHVGLRFKWEIFLTASDTHGSENEDTYSDPDGLWADPDGRLFIQTDGGQQKNLNNQMLVTDVRNGELHRLFTGVTKDEITGITTTPDRRTMFVNIQHPGNGDPSLTNFPEAFDGVTVPRDATIVITRKDGGIIGS